ncbi:upstream stimulatory factor 2 isoform X4 [Takifugu rubripes]|uniref:upstream stimulatory factor 2 isoform X4 n=1 Tax=Takifugu rubripes TaxID=31033 RepID=UPI0005D1AD29|nr:upstream stimulatory factor 2 isoform X4 [Takifugu rubripes]XP_056876498.1 upstream stimulatory factor 2 isoform X4 [Takifugu flavidus]|eukprot:XP_011607639.1 PREDICTED: upstream stimulatory factor 2 isoform X4 [Takifugu rubripes]
MDLLEQSLDSSASHDKQETEEVVQLQEGDSVVTEEQTAVIAGVPQAAFADNVQYQFRTENNGGQAVIQNPFSNGSSPAAETVGAETRFAYFPAATVSDGTATAVSVQATADPTITQAGGQFYVMMNPEVLQTASPRTIAPRTHTYTADLGESQMLQHGSSNWKVEGSRAPRDERRRAQHNEVERRRRDKINNWIVTLSKIIPDCSVDSRTGASKGGILSKACDYIRELRQNNQQLQESYKEVERVEMDNELLRQQIEELKNDNALLRAQLQQHGIELNGDATPQ